MRVTEVAADADHNGAVDDGPDAGEPTPASGTTPGTFVERLGGSLAAPVHALAAADTPERAGKPAGDAALLLFIAFAVVHTGQLVTAGWMVIDGEVGAAFQTLVSWLARDLSTPLISVFVGGIALTLAAGRRRNVGADFDLACVAVIPLIAVELAGSLVIVGIGIEAPRWATDTLGILGYGWALAVWALALRQARSRPLPGGEA